MTESKTSRLPLSQLAVWLAILCAACLPLVARAAAQPNILLIISDDQGYPDLGCIGTTPVLTPNLDRLAKDGIRATSFYVTCPACTPSRGSMLTGRYPQRNGLYELVRNDLVNYGHRYTRDEYSTSPEMTQGLDPKEITIGDVLKRAGYRTGVVGKWDMGQAKRYLPLQRGFDFFYGFGNNGIDYYTHERYGIPSMFRGNNRTEADKGTYATYLFQREAMEFIAQPSAKPWFLYLAFNAPHAASTYSTNPPAGTGKTANRPPGEGVQVPEKFAKLYRGKARTAKLANYYGAITCMDEAIGEVLKLIRQRNEETNTLVLFVSDNGGSGNGNNNPLRGGKGNMFEGGVRVPFIARWPGKIPAGRISEDFLTTLEFFPTLAGAAGATVSPGLNLDGFDMLPVLSGAAKSPRNEMFWKWRDFQVVRVENWKWVSGPKDGGLFNLANDIGEKTDLSKKNPSILSRLQARFQAWEEEMKNSEPRGPFRDY